MGKGFPCDYLRDVVCPRKKCSCLMNPSVCMGLKCPHFARFMRKMDEEDERVMDEIEEIRRTGVWK